MNCMTPKSEHEFPSIHNRHLLDITLNVIKISLFNYLYFPISISAFLSLLLDLTFWFTFTSSYPFTSLPLINYTLHSPNMQAYQPKTKLVYVLNTKFSTSKTEYCLVAFRIQSKSQVTCVRLMGSWRVRNCIMCFMFMFMVPCIVDLY